MYVCLQLAILCNRTKSRFKREFDTEIKIFKLKIKFEVSQVRSENSNDFTRSQNFSPDGFGCTNDSLPIL